MKIAQHMEAIFVAILLVLGAANLAISAANSVLPELPFVHAAAKL